MFRTSAWPAGPLGANWWDPLAPVLTRADIGVCKCTNITAAR